MIVEAAFDFKVDNKIVTVRAKRMSVGKTLINGWQLHTFDKDGTPWIWELCTSPGCGCVGLVVFDGDPKVINTLTHKVHIIRKRPG